MGKFFTCAIALLSLLTAAVASTGPGDPLTPPKLDVSFQAPAPSASPWSGALFGSIRGKSFVTNAVVINKLIDLTKKGKIVGFEIDGFVGTTVDKNGKSVGGFALGKTWVAFDQVSFYVGFGASIAVNEAPRVGVLAGLSIHF